MKSEKTIMFACSKHKRQPHLLLMSERAEDCSCTGLLNVTCLLLSI